MLEVGAVLDRKYKILNEIGRGGMSVVYLAINEKANKTWAVKEVRKDGVSDFEAVRQGLVVETNMLKKFKHPNLPSIIDVIDLEDSFIIVMDYIEGKSLQKILKESGAQPPELVVKWGIQLCDVLGYLHNQNPPIIYRDMKPSNVMLKPDGNVTLIDFGTAREFKNKSMVEDTTCLGTRGYAAPEQFGGHGQTDARTDVYCLGATLYHLLTGHSPAEPPYEIKPLSYWNAVYAGSGLEKIINKCCQQDPSARYQSCAELAYDLEHVSDFDDAVMRSRRLKWAAFLFSVLICLAGIIGAVGFTIAKNNETQNTYDFFIRQANTVTNFDEQVEYVKQALHLSPGRPEAYTRVLKLIRGDGKLTADETTALWECILMQSGNQTVMDALRATDPAAYADVQLQIGEMFFLLSETGVEGVKMSAQYFQNALSTGALDADEREWADSLYRIASNSGAFNNSADPYDKSGGSGSSGNSAKTLWNDLNVILDDNKISNLGYNPYRIAIYDKSAYLIKINAQRIFNAGVSIDEMKEQVQRIEQGLNSMAFTDDDPQTVQELRQEALKMVEAARKNLDGMGSNQMGSGGEKS